MNPSGDDAAMAGALDGKVAIVVGGGQAPGETMGNGRATAIQFAKAGARVAVVDRSGDSAQETVDLITQFGGQAFACTADVVSEQSLAKMVDECVARFGRIDVLHNNVGISVTGGDAHVEDISEAAFDLIYQVNLRGMAMTCKHVLPVMREQKSGVILNVSSMGALAVYPTVGYKTTKMAVIALTQHIAARYAPLGIRANAILPGLLDTPMAIEARHKDFGTSRQTIREERNARVPLRGKMGTAWDVAYAAVFLASDMAGFITGVSLPIDGGANVNLRA